ncbi:MAG: hypothetical protein U0939_25445 [Pirellulales bacterium]
MADSDKLKAAAKIVGGAAQVLSGIATATGHGLIGGYLRQHHMMAQATMIGKKSVEKGSKLFQDGLREWNR